MLHRHKFTLKDFHHIKLASKGVIVRTVTGIEGLECKCGKRKVNYPDLGYSYTKASDMPFYKKWEIIWMRGEMIRPGLWCRFKLAFGKILMRV